MLLFYRSIKLATCTYLLSLCTVTIHKGSKIIAQPLSYSLREASCACVYLVRNYMSFALINDANLTRERFHEESAKAGKITNFFELVGEPLPIRWTPAEPSRKNRLSAVWDDLDRLYREQTNKSTEAIAAFLLALKPTTVPCES